jgi:hypothetical protein
MRAAALSPLATILSPPIAAEGSFPLQNVAANAADGKLLAMVKRYRENYEKWSLLVEDLEAAENVASESLGSRPFALIAWRNYSHIGGPEIDSARGEFLGMGISPEIVEKEYRDAQKRYSALRKAGDAWDRKAGITKKRKSLKLLVDEASSLEAHFGVVEFRSLADAMCVLEVLHARAERYGDIGDDWECAAFLNVTRFLFGRSSTTTADCAA